MVGNTKKTLTVTLDPADIDRIEAAVASGAFTSPSEVIEEALAVWAASDADGELDRRLQAAYRSGIASGTPRELHLDALLRDLKRG
ncbi:type II toxin-antitoxin system ParD family antitoxin [Pseudomonas sp. R2.Fl]|nr:type II toxin-antitoxin system ParD family antitoxin [Pseudomonas sp. R2.Fl]